MGSHQETMLSNPAVIGVLEVFVHQARGIHNICIYHKQDVYAKIFLTNDPESTESTQIIDGGGQNPVFNQSLKINIRKGDGSLRCEIWMLSRIKNYLQDQLLGFALVPLSEILVNNRNLEKEFELSTNDLFHSPSGFVKLNLNYEGKSPDLVEIPTVSRSLCDQDSDESDHVSCELEKIEFPDPKMLNENEIMVSEYYSTCDEIQSQSLVNSDSNNHLENLENPSRFYKENLETPPRNEENLENASRFSKENLDNPSRFSKENLETPSRNDSKPSEDEKDNTHSVVETLLQQDIVDMYMKSMKQFTEALAKMKLPLEKGSKDNTESNEGSKGEGPSPKVFYGSRAFF